MQHFTYILKCSDDSLYTGSTNNLERRLKQHNESRNGAHYTKTRRPVTLIYSEGFETLKEARKREMEIKSWNRSQKMDLVNSNPLTS